MLTMPQRYIFRFKKYLFQNKKIIIVTTYKSITYTPPESIKNRIFFATIRAFFRYEIKQLRIMN